MKLTSKQLARLRSTQVGAAGNRLQIAIDLVEETKVSVAEGTDLPYSYVTDTVAGRYQTITVEKAHKFADHFGCSIEDLFPAREAIAS